MKLSLWCNHFWIKTQDYSLLPITLLNLITDYFIRVFWNSCTKKHWKISRKTYVVKFPLNVNAQIQSAAYYRTENVLKVLKPQQIFENCPFSPNVTGLQPTISDVSKNRLQEKCFLWVFWNSWKFTRKMYIMKSFDQTNSTTNRN